MNKNYIEVQLYGNPQVDVRAVLPGDDEFIIKDKNKKPFIAKNRAILKVYYKGEWLIISNPVNYIYDGATIPFRIGKGNMKLLIPALYHDIICENKGLVHYNRYLSSLIFTQLLIQCKVNKYIAAIMFIAVDNFQKLMRGWE